MTDREQTFRKMVADFPDSPMGHFSLGKLCLEEKRWAEAAESLGRACALDKGYAAAFVALAEAKRGLGDLEGARQALNDALQTPHGKRDLSLQADIEQMLEELE